VVASVVGAIVKGIAGAGTDCAWAGADELLALEELLPELEPQAARRVRTVEATVTATRRLDGIEISPVFVKSKGRIRASKSGLVD